jgi:hypothetical protein
VITIRPVAYATAALAVTAALASCSGDSEAAPGTTTKTITASPTSGENEAISAETIIACRSLADDKNLAEFWHKVNNSEAVYGWDAQPATMAVMQMDQYAADPDVDTAVADVMKTAVVEMGNMNEEMASGSTEFDIDRFRNIITPVVTACEDADVDMTVK